MIRDITSLLKDMNPQLNDGVFVFLSLPDSINVHEVSCIATFREAEGMSLITSEREAQRLGLPTDFRSAWITLQVPSSLEAIGFTAQISSALTSQSISCNVVAAFRHDHLFVPYERRHDAMRCLVDLSALATSLVADIHHVQITVPTKAESEAREFYCNFLELPEIPKPSELARRGGFWIRIGDRSVHVGVEDGVDRNRTRAHVAYRVSDLDECRRRLQIHAIPIKEGIPLPGLRRLEFRDPFGNRVELVQVTEAATR